MGTVTNPETGGERLRMKSFRYLTVFDGKGSWTLTGRERLGPGKSCPSRPRLPRTYFRQTTFLSLLFPRDVSYSPRDSVLLLLVNWKAHTPTEW